jgi:hypothetical protein
MIVFGGRLFGKVDQVPGLFHVATQFFHVNFVPLVPTKSWLVLHGTEKSGLGRTAWQGIELRSIRWGSVGMAWLRFGLVVASVVFGFVSLGAFLGKADPANGAVAGLLAAASVAALIASYRIVRATGESLRKLASDASVPADLVQQAQAVVQGRKGPSSLVR